MVSRGCERRGCPRENNQPPPVFDPHAFIEAISTIVVIIVQASVMAATTARTSAMVGQGGMSNLQGFQAHHPPTYMGEGDSMVRTSLSIEREVDDTRSIRDIGAGAERNENKSSSNSGKKQKTAMPLGPQGRNRRYQGQGQTRASSQSGPMTCFHCHQPEHVRQDCPQR